MFYLLNILNKLSLLCIIGILFLVTDIILLFFYSCQCFCHLYWCFSNTLRNMPLRTFFFFTFLFYSGVLQVQHLPNEHTVCLLALIQHNSSTICERNSKTASGYTGIYPTTRLPTVHHYSYKKLAWGREGGDTVV